MPVTVNIPESVIQAFPTQERDALRRLVELISQAVDTSQAALTLDDLADVSAAAPTNTQVLTFDSADDRWEAANASGGSISLGDLTDVTLTSDANGQILMRNSTGWANQYPNAVVSISGDTNLAFGPSLVSRSFVGSYIRSTDGAATLTVPSDANWTSAGDETAPGIGAEITIEQASANAVTIAAGSGATVNVNSSLTLVTNGQYAVVGLKKVAANTWVAFGNLVAA